ncbi:uncharacterized protein METZ01_LOCUS104033, partial [marine metagenome]
VSGSTGRDAASRRDDPASGDDLAPFL